MARDILDLGADVYDDTVVASKHRISPKKRNYMIGLPIAGVLLAGIITFAIIAANTFLKDVDNLENIQFYYTPTSMLEEGEEQTLTLYKLDPNTKYPATFRIPERVKGYKVAHVGPEAFVGHTEIKKVIFTKYVKSIGEKAFSNCSNLESFSWNKALTDIGNDAFYGTKFLTNLEKDNKGFYKIPSGVLLYVGKDYFPANTALIPDSLSTEERLAIELEYGLADGNLYSFESLNITNLTSGLFKNNDKVVYVSFPSFLNKVGKELFNGASSLKGVDFSHSSVTEIGDAAFENCSALEDISFSTVLATIGSDAFANTAITYVPELHNITSMGSGIFRNCHQLESVYYPVSENITTVPNEMFSGCSALKEIVWGSNVDAKDELVTSFGYGAFAGTAFTEFVVPKNVTAILDNTFQNCASLQKVTFYGPINDDDIVPGSDEEGFTHIDKDGNEVPGTLVGIADIRSNAFSGDSALATINWVDKNNTVHGNNGEFTFPRSLQTTNIDSFNLNDNRTFQGSAASKITIANNTTAIGSYAFSEMSELTTVEFAEHSSLRNIGSNAFENDIKLESFSVPSSVTNLGSSSFRNCYSLNSIDFNGAEINGIRPYTFENCTSLTSIDIPETVSAIYEGAFKGATGLSDYVIIPENITQLNSGAFADVREEGATDKLQLLIDLKYSDMKYVNAAKDWYDEDCATVSYALSSASETKVPGVSYWNGDNDAPVIIKLSDVTYTGTLERTAYTAGEILDSTGLTITAHYDDSTSITIDDTNIEWEILESGDTEAKGTYTVGDSTKTIIVTGITVE
ncbi:MAG: leucine-rich repeat domain-containing protein [Bacilli bacterium]|nr:leucine-rich repeat domain-containing protein [Bacilli bacterium]